MSSKISIPIHQLVLFLSQPTPPNTCLNSSNSLPPYLLKDIAHLFTFLLFYPFTFKHLPLTP